MWVVRWIAFALVWMVKMWTQCSLSLASGSIESSMSIYSTTSTTLWVSHLLYMYFFSLFVVSMQQFVVDHWYHNHYYSKHETNCDVTMYTIRTQVLRSRVTNRCFSLILVNIHNILTELVWLSPWKTTAVIETHRACIFHILSTFLF